MVDWLESIAKDEIGDFSDNIEFYAKSVYWWVQISLIVYMLPSSVRFTCTDTESLLKKKWIFKSYSVHSLLFFKFLDVKIEILYPSTEMYLLKSQLLLLGGEDGRKTIKAT